jgi:hypothetical protein
MEWDEEGERKVDGALTGEESSTQSITRAVNTSILEGGGGGRFRKSSSRQLQCQFTVSISSSNNDGDGGDDSRQLKSTPTCSGISFRASWVRWLIRSFDDPQRRLNA